MITVALSLTDYQTYEVNTMMYHDTLSYIAVLKGIIYSRSVIVISEYVDLLSHIGSQVFVATPCLS